MIIKMDCRRRHLPCTNHAFLLLIHHQFFLYHFILFYQLKCDYSFYLNYFVVFNPSIVDKTSIIDHLNRVQSTQIGYDE
jgi:hypothetical protein